MGFIKNALIGIVIYEALKYWMKESRSPVTDIEQISLGGKCFAKTLAQPVPDARHRHHMDRPEILSEPGTL